MLEDLNFETGMMINHARIIFDRLLGREEKEAAMSHMKAINEKVRGKETAIMTASGTVSESGCDGRSASAEL